MLYIALMPAALGWESVVVKRPLAEWTACMFVIAKLTGKLRMGDDIGDMCQPTTCVARLLSFFAPRLARGSVNAMSS